jgi:mRNA-degrading endonuclease toxin of MazEF toxin-antitoxin module
MRRGDVVRVRLPRPAGPPGREQHGIRPAIDVQIDAANLATAVIVPLTSNLGATQFFGSFIMDPSKENGLDVRSVVLTHQIRAIDRSRIEDVIGTLGKDDLSELERNLTKLLGL